MTSHEPQQTSTTEFKTIVNQNPVQPLRLAGSSHPTITQYAIDLGVGLARVQKRFGYLPCFTGLKCGINSPLHTAHHGDTNDIYRENVP